MYKPIEIKLLSYYGLSESLKAMRLPMQGGRSIKKDDISLAKSLIKAGGSHAKFSRGIIFYIEITMQAGFMIELDTYRIGREVLSTTSSMHNELRYMNGLDLAEQKQADLIDKQYTQIMMISAQTLRKIYHERKNHRHPDWKIFCNFIEKLELSYLIIPEVVCE
jgi:hypothetical protein